MSDQQTGVEDTTAPTDSPSVLVVGGGFAGCVAALAAAREQPAAAVELLVVADDRFDAHSGTVDVLGYTGDEPVEVPLDALGTLPADHPYRQLGRDRLRAALSMFDAALDYRGGATERNALAPTHAGRVRPVARYPAGMAAGLVSRDEPMRLVGFEQTPDLDASFVADRLAAQLPYEVAANTVTFPGTVTEYPSGPVLAAALDEDEAPSGDVGQPDMDLAGAVPPDMDASEAMSPMMGGDDGGPARDPLVERVRPLLDTEGRVGFPAVLGLTDHDTVRAELADALHADVFEVPLGPPSIPGRRLERRLHAALTDAGVTITHDTVTDVETGDGRVRRVSLSGGQRAAESVVLATGDLTGPGLTTDRTGIHEPIFGCHVELPDDRSDWTGSTPLSEHPLVRAGVSVDTDLRPLDSSGRPEYDNLRVAGRLVGGVDYDAEQSADGVALVTGHAAGNWSVP
ncbi:MAG: anaerobic glycerol-3-phosphate dehydrogenase [halophilic archaeon J07HX64]|nr:MAG: anaerobic glycerol-3-phosphate dehydrogenase [halophilic archaeon J07HX64]